MCCILDFIILRVLYFIFIFSVPVFAGSTINLGVYVTNTDAFFALSALSPSVGNVPGGGCGGPDSYQAVFDDSSGSWIGFGNVSSDTRTLYCSSGSQTGAGCPSGTVESVSDGHCDNSCESGSLTSECRVNCPAIDYTYTLNGITFRGSIGGGSVGFGQACPQPSYPNGSDAGCVGSVGSCGPDWDNGSNGSAGTSSSTSTSTTTSNGDGTSTTTSTASSSSSSSSGPSVTFAGAGGVGDGGAGSGVGGAVIGEDGVELTPGQYTETIPLGNNTFGLCPNGGVVGANGNCDYPSHNCLSGQIDTSTGCQDIPTSNPLPPSPAVTITTTDTDANGNTVTTTTSVDASSGSNSTTTSEQIESSSSSGAASGCDSPPASSGDAQLAAIHMQLWNNRCLNETSGSLDCSLPFSCDGDFFECAVLERNYEFDCSVLDSENVEQVVSDLAVDKNLVSVFDLESQAAVNGIDFDAEVDLTGTLTELESVPTTSGSCPADIAINLGGLGTITIPFSELCSLLTWIGYLVRLSAALVAFRMLFSTIQGV